MLLKPIFTSLKKHRFLFIALILAGGIFVLAQCSGSGSDTELGVTGTYSKDYSNEKAYANAYPPKDITSVNGENATLTELADFAWQHFIALNWPASTTQRSKPDTKKSFLTGSAVGTSYVPVWLQYWHRNELFPAPDNGKKGKAFKKLPAPKEPKLSEMKPNYQYQDYFKGNGTGDTTHWNNLDEANELTIDIVYAHSTVDAVDEEYQVLYEAKVNFECANYIYGSNLIDSTTRVNRRKKTTADVVNSNYDVCNTDSTTYICLPCGGAPAPNNNQSMREGNIEIKAAWRKLTTDELNSNKYYTREVIFYENSGASYKYATATMGLVGLHIIHKTKTFPQYIFATWEHVDNEKSSLVYNESSTGREFEKGGAKDPGETAGKSYAVSRDHDIPTDISAVNTTVSKFLNTKNSVWQYYKLINVQGKPQDAETLGLLVDDGSGTKVVDLTKAEDVKYSDFFLANLVIETNRELQTFTGLQGANKITEKNIVVKGKQMNMGGCQGCHGVAQLKKGSDFNFLIANAPFRLPEASESGGKPSPGCPPGALPQKIEVWDDVSNFFDACAPHTGVTMSYHGEFWKGQGSKEKNYCNFTTGSADSYQICDCSGNKGEESNIIIFLRGKDVKNNNPSHYHMPRGGAYFTSGQIDELSKWIDAGCPYDGKGTYVPSKTNQHYKSGTSTICN